MSGSTERPISVDERIGVLHQRYSEGEISPRDYIQQAIFFMAERMDLWRGVRGEDPIHQETLQMALDNYIEQPFSSANVSLLQDRALGRLETGYKGQNIACRYI